MFRNRFIRGLVGTLFFLTFLGAAPVVGEDVQGLPPPGVHIPLKDAPEISQYDPSFSLPNDGEADCSAAATAMVMRWFADHGYPGLFLARASVPKDAENKWFVEHLDRCLQVDPDYGIDPSKLLKGLRRHLDESGYSDAKVEYSGWRDWEAPERREPPDLGKILWALSDGPMSGRQAVLFRVRWLYGQAPKRTLYPGGHIVVPIGYSLGPQSGGDATSVFILDPDNEEPSKPHGPYTWSIRKISTLGTIEDTKFERIFSENGQIYFELGRDKGLIAGATFIEMPVRLATTLTEFGYSFPGF